MTRAPHLSPHAARSAARGRWAACASLLFLTLAAPAARAGGSSSGCSSACAAAHCAQAHNASCTVATCPVRPGCEGSSAATNASAPPVGQAELRAVIDPESGGLTLAPLWATAMPLEQIAARNFSSDGLLFETLPGGGGAVDLQGRFQSYSIARRALDGQLENGCTENPSSLFLWFYGLAPSTPPVARTER